MHVMLWSQSVWFILWFVSHTHCLLHLCACECPWEGWSDVGWSIMHPERSGRIYPTDNRNMIGLKYTCGSIQNVNEKVLNPAPEQKMPMAVEGWTYFFFFKLKVMVSTTTENVGSSSSDGLVEINCSTSELKENNFFYPTQWCRAFPPF